MPGSVVSTRIYEMRDLPGGLCADITEVICNAIAQGESLRF